MQNLFVEIALTSGTRYLSLKDIYYSPIRVTEDDEERILESGESRVVEETYAYRGDLVDEFDIEQALPDIWYGVEETSAVTVVLADNRVDSWYDIIDAEEIRGCAVVIYDEDRNFVASGKIAGYVFGDDIRLNVELRNDEIFDKNLPAAVVTGAAFDASAIDIGAPINIVFGYCKNVPLPNVCNDTVNDYYDYLIGYGPVESLHVDHSHGYGVKRDGVLVDTDEYTFYDGSQVSPYNGYAFIRFTVEQKGFGGQYHKIHADVYGLKLGGASADRNFSNCIKALINNATWGLNQSVNAASFAAAATTLTDWKCDYALYRQQAARDILDNMLFAARSWLYLNVDGEWCISVDGTASSSASFGENDGYYNNCVIESVSAADAKNAISTARVRYDDDRYEISLAVRTGFGVERIYSVPCTTDLTTAKKVLSYVYGRAYYADKTLVMLADRDAEDLSPGNVITVTSSRHNLSAATYRVTRITKSLTKYRLECEAYNASIFDDQTISDPTAAAIVYVAHDLQTIDSGYVGGMVITGTAIATADGLVGMSSAVTAGTDWRIWAGHATPASAPFRVDETGAMWATNATISGSVTATTGTIGGFTLGATTLTGTNLILDSGNQEIRLGTGNDIVYLDAADATYRLWIGHATAGSAPFRVTKAGAMTATSGTLGGWTIDSNSIYCGVKDYSGYTAGGLTIYNSGGTGSIHAPKFYIDTSGVLHCYDAEFDGTVPASSNITVAQGADVIFSGGSSGDPSLLRMIDGSGVSSEIRFEYNTDSSYYFEIRKVPTAVEDGSYLNIGPSAGLVGTEYTVGIAIGAVIDGDGNLANYSDNVSIIAANTYIYGQTAIYLAGVLATPDIYIQGTTYFTYSSYWTDNDSIYLGTGNDLRLYHSGSHSYITNATGNLYITGDAVFNDNVTTDHIYTNSNNSYDIGSSGTRFRNCYLSGTLYVTTEIAAALISFGFSGSGTKYIHKDSTHRFIGCYYDGTNTYGQLFYNNTATVAAAASGATVAGHVTATGVLFLAERASAASDIAGYGQLWIKNTTPCELWFTDDAGTDTKIV